MMKRRMAWLVVLAMLLSMLLTACGEQADTDVATSTTPSQTSNTTDTEQTTLATTGDVVTTESFSTTQTETTPVSESTAVATTSAVQTTTTTKATTTATVTTTTKATTAATVTTTSTTTATATSTTTATTTKKPTAVKQETPPKFASGYYSPSQKTYIETDYVVYEIDPNIYIIGDLAERTDELCKALETVTGLKFNNKQYGGKKILVYVCRENIPREGSEMSAGRSFAETGPYESSRGDECMHRISLTSPCALFTGKGTLTLVHELAHVLRYSQTSTNFTPLLEEGFAEYTTYKTIEYLEKQKSSTGFLLGSTIGTTVVFDFMGQDFSSNNLLYWLSLDEFNSHDVIYPLGANLMAYLDSKYHNYTAWIKKAPKIEGGLSGKKEWDLLKTAYEESFAKAFYPWAEANRKEVEAIQHFYDPYSQNTQDLTGYPPLSFYADFSNYGRWNSSLTDYSFKYKDLYVNLEEAKRFLGDYKGRNTDDLYLTLSDAVTVQYFNKNGRMLMESQDKLVNVAGVSYIKLVGSGYLGQLQLVGYYSENMKYKDGDVIFSGTADFIAENKNADSLTTAYVSNSMEFAWDTELAFSKAYTLVLQLDSPCDIQIYDRTWESSFVYNVKELVISNLRYFDVWNRSGKLIPAKIIVKKNKK